MSLCPQEKRNMNIAMSFVSRIVRGVSIAAFLASLFACAGQPTESQVQSTIEDANALADLQAWMRKENPNELAVFMPPDQVSWSPDGTRWPELDECARVSQDLAEVAINEMVLDSLIKAGITPISYDGRAAPQNLILAVTLRCNDADYEYTIYFAHMDEKGATARPVSYGRIGSRAETDPSDVLNSLSHQLEVVVADYMTANSI